MVKQGTSYKIYVDGNLAASSNVFMNINQGTMNATVGGSTVHGTTGGDYGRTNCGLSSVRMTNTAVYTGSFTPTTDPLTAISGTIFLTCQDKLFKDNSSNNFTINVQKGTPMVDSSSPFSNTGTSYAQNSMYFDGNGDYLSVPNSSNFVFGSSPFTIEMWVNPAGNQGSGAQKYLFGKRASTSIYNSVLSFLTYNTTTLKYSLSFYAAGSSSSWMISSTTGYVINPNTWNHIAIVRNAPFWTVYVNGVAQTSVNNTNNAFESGTDPFVVGSVSTTNPGTSGFAGYIDDFRVTKGIARYTGSFTPPDSLDVDPVIVYNWNV